MRRGEDGPSVIAIDGPAGSGKSTVAAEVAERLGWPRLDTGAMYRSVAWAALERGIDLADDSGLAALAAQLDIDVAEKISVDGVDVTGAIRSAEVDRAVSVVASVPAVREVMVRHQRRWIAGRAGAVVEGRDIATVVFPEAELKVYLTASAGERASRRARQHQRSDPGIGSASVSDIAVDLARRDHLDSHRAISPLAVAEGSWVIDTTGLTVEEVVDQVVAKVRNNQ